MSVNFRKYQKKPEVKRKLKRNFSFINSHLLFNSKYGVNHYFLYF